MGSGEKFRVRWISESYVSLGLFIGKNMEHEWSIAITLLKLDIYIGIGKGYDER